MKRTTLVIILLAILVVSCLVLTACSQEKHTVTWQNWDGTVLEVDAEVEEGTIFVYDGATPTREKDAQYTYTFSGWEPSVDEVTGNVTYVAQFSTEINKYTVTWQNWDGSVLELDENVEYGKMPSYDGETPTREKDAQYTYTFSGWEPSVDSVTGNVTYVAQFSTEINKYTVTWQNWDGSVLELDENVEYGKMPSYDGETPTKEGNAQYTYTFSGWSPNVDEVTGNVTYVAQFSTGINKYTVTWQNWDGSVLELDENVEFGKMPSYDGETPTKEGNAQYSYTFTGWSPSITAVTGDKTYTAQFSSSVNSYTITWNIEGSTTTETYAYGATPSYKNGTPTKEGNAQYSYTFSRWSPSMTTVTGDKTYTAQFSSKSIFDIFEVQDGWAIEKYNGSEARISIPSQIDGKTIVEIGENAFAYNTKLLSITLPDTIVRIDDYAFCGCTRLYDFKNSSNCQSVGRMCLADTSLKEITIPESLTNIGAYWTLLSPIEKIIILGNRDSTSFVGDYLGVARSTTVYIDGINNKLNDHFTQVKEDVSFTTVANAEFGPQKVPTRTEYTYNLKDENRYFYITQTILSETRTIKVFANESENSYKYGTSTTYEYEYPGWGTWTFVDKTVTSIQGVFYFGIDSLKTIDISSASNIDTSVLIGRLDNVSIQN